MPITIPVLGANSRARKTERYGERDGSDTLVAPPERSTRRVGFWRSEMNVDMKSGDESRTGAGPNERGGPVAGGRMRFFSVRVRPAGRIRINVLVSLSVGLFMVVAAYLFLVAPPVVLHAEVGPALACIDCPSPETGCEPECHGGGCTPCP